MRIKIALAAMIFSPFALGRPAAVGPNCPAVRFDDGKSEAALNQHLVL
ncbi:MAG: hypothetical protein ABSE16_14255 [Verrucomicrobiota bacterium]|jgi:hypothetical protein